MGTTVNQAFTPARHAVGRAACERLQFRRKSQGPAMLPEPHDPHLTPVVPGLRLSPVDPATDLAALDLLAGTAADFALAYMRASPDCVKLLTPEGRLAFMNRNGQCAMHIEDFDAVRDEFWWTLWPSVEEARLREAVERTAQGLAVNFEAFCPTARGEPRWWELSLLPIIGDAAGRTALILAISRDVSERHEGREKTTASGGARRPRKE